MKISLNLIIILLSLSSKAEVIFDDSYLSQRNLGGDGSYIANFGSVVSFKQPLKTLSLELQEKHVTGDGLFEKKFSDDPTRSDYGLGPAYNNISCASCHIRDGRGSLPVINNGTWTKLGQNEALFLRISIEPENQKNLNAYVANALHGEPVAVPGYSKQLFHLGSYHLRKNAPSTGQAEVWMKYEYTNFTYADGQVVKLKKPLFEIRNPYDLTIDEAGQPTSRLYQKDVRVGPRMTPPMIGLGLLEAIEEKDILALANRDLSSWGIKGRPNWVYDIEKQKNNFVNVYSLGRFGLKANTPSVLHQSLGAFHGDMGITNSYFPEESIANTPLIESILPSLKPGINIGDEDAFNVVFYSQTLAVPSRRQGYLEEDIISGGKTFKTIGCTNCHQPEFITGKHSVDALSYQRIAPYTDLLLHDMGEGLADNRRDFQASGRDWKTRPLWGIGLTKTINARGGFLHDGRASTIEEAILWHGGEAQMSRNKFTELAADQRAQVIKFINSL
jgi:CxxC motif-containing protein (DUF1111 family)